MYNELLSQLENKIQDAVETIEMYRREIADLKEKNAELENQHQTWEEKLSLLISKFEYINVKENNESKELNYDSPISEITDVQDSTTDAASDDESGGDLDTSSAYSSTTALGSQAVASSSHYSSYDEKQ